MSTSSTLASVRCHGLATMALIAAMSALMAATAVPAHGQRMAGKSRIELDGGMTFPGGTTSRSSVGSIVSEVESVAGMGAISFSHWVREQVAITVSLGASAVQVESSVGNGGVRSRTAVVSPLMGGVRLYPEPNTRRRFRPYGSLTAGPVFGTESESIVGSSIVNRSRTEAAFGVRIGAGFDVPFATHWIYGMFAGYSFMTDFSEAIGSQRNHSTPDFGFSIGWTWGGGR